MSGGKGSGWSSDSGAALSEQERNRSWASITDTGCGYWRIR